MSLYDANNTSPTALIQLTTSNGDLEHVTLRRRGLVYEGSIISANDAFVGIRDEFLDTIPSDFISAYYNDPVAASGGSQLVQVTVPVQPEYTVHSSSRRNGCLRDGKPAIHGAHGRAFLSDVSQGQSALPVPVFRSYVPFDVHQRERKHYVRGSERDRLQ